VPTPIPVFVPPGVFSGPPIAVLVPAPIPPMPDPVFVPPSISVIRVIRGKNAGDFARAIDQGNLRKGSGRRLERFISASPAVPLQIEGHVGVADALQSLGDFTRASIG
jgi:hypothetical protein